MTPESRRRFIDIFDQVEKYARKAEGPPDPDDDCHDGAYERREAFLNALADELEQLIHQEIMEFMRNPPLRDRAPLRFLTWLRGH